MFFRWTGELINCYVYFFYFQAFSFFDQDGDGTITADELCQCMKKLGEDLTKEEIEEMVKEADADGNGEIEFSGLFFFLFSYFTYP